MTVERYQPCATHDARTVCRIAWVAVISSTEAGHGKILVRLALLPLIRRETITGGAR